MNQLNDEFFDLAKYITTSPTTTDQDPVDTNLWWFLTTFWNYLTDDDRDLFESYWSGLRTAVNDMIDKSTRFANATAPEASEVNTVDHYYEITLGPLTSKPLYPDPTGLNNNYTIRPKTAVLVEPGTDSEYNPVYNDMIEIRANDYYSIRSVGLECYVVVTPDSASLPTKYFKIANLLSSEEPVDRACYAEITSAQNDELLIPNDDVGVIALEGDLSSNIDVTEWLIEIVQGASMSAAWTNNSLFITITSGATISQVLAVTNVGGKPFTLVDKSGANSSGDKKVGVPTFGLTSGSLDEHAVRFKMLSNFKNKETANGRYYPCAGQVWKWYDGFEQNISDIGHADKGEYVYDATKNKYLIVTNGDLSYLGDNTFSIYLTTGRAYDVGPEVIDVPYLHSHISSGYSVEFGKTKDYTFYDYIIEFNRDIFADDDAVPGTIFYCKETPVMEQYLYESYGNLVGMPDWHTYHHDNYTGKTAIVNLLSGVQDASSTASYWRAMNAYYGLPLAPMKSRISGLYESYSYLVTAVNGNQITLLKNSEDLHPFIQKNSNLYVDGKGEVLVASIVNRTDGILTYSSSTVMIEVNDLVNVKLANRFALKGISAEVSYPTPAPAYLIIYSLEGPAALQLVIDTINATTGKYPEIVIYGTENLTVNYNGIYHATSAIWQDPDASTVKITLYKKTDITEPLYNDYIGTTNLLMPSGWVHMPWPTHKYLYLQMNNGDFYKAYIDTPLDTIYDSGDFVEQYEILLRNASVFTKLIFPDWYQYDVFHKSCGISQESDVVETTRAISYADFGAYFSSRYMLTTA